MCVCAYTMESEIMSFTGKWMELEDIILSEICQRQKDNYHIIFLMCGNQNEWMNEWIRLEAEGLLDNVKYAEE
jgi:hypothetical protein